MIKMMTEQRIRANRIRRQRQLRRNITLFSFAVIIVIFISIFMGTMLSAQAETKEPVYKYYTSIVVEYGDTMWSIADAYTEGSEQSIQAYIDEVISINHLDDENIHAGQSIVVPYYSKEFVS